LPHPAHFPKPDTNTTHGLHVALAFIIAMRALTSATKHWICGGTFIAAITPNAPAGTEWSW
jgi:hypothetical protein